MRPVPARWFELLTARDDLTNAVEALARTGTVELETHSEITARLSVPDLHGQMEEYNRLAHRYHAYWPKSDLRPTSEASSPARTLERALHQLYGWREEADPLIHQLEGAEAEQTELKLLLEMLEDFPSSDLNLGLLVKAGPALSTRLFILPPAAQLTQLPPGLLHTRIPTSRHLFLLVVGPPNETYDLEQELLALKGRRLHLPEWLSGAAEQCVTAVEKRLAELDRATVKLRGEIEALSTSHNLATALGDLARLEWFLTHATGLPVSENFAWVSGWTSDLAGNKLHAALRRAKVRTLLRFPQPPRDKAPPMVMHNPWWAQPFEIFARLLGTPAKDEADPSRLLAFIAPLMFGYMFGDLGQGLVLFLTGLLLQHRWPALRLLIAGGLTSMAFGLVFGSVFSMEHVIPPLWVAPMENPLQVLGLPLIGGVLLLLLGLLLNGVEAYWRAAIYTWWHVDAPVLALYLGLVGTLVHPASLVLATLGLAWYLGGSLRLARKHRFRALGAAVGRLFESMMQLAVNTLSFVRVGAFALAHAGLSSAVVSIADITGHPLAFTAVMVLGNLVVIVLEGLVVSIQTTRLVLFEFFIRFLRGEGRVFRPLGAPPASVSTETTRRKS